MAGPPVLPVHGGNARYGLRSDESPGSGVARPCFSTSGSRPHGAESTVGAVSNATEIGLSPRTSVGVSAWADPSGIRGVIRHDLGRQAAIILLGASLVGAISGVGDPLVFLILALGASAQFAAAPVLRRLGRTFPPETDFRIAVAGWPIALLVLSATGWTTDLDLGEVVAVAGFVMAALVALAESTVVAAVWAAVAGLAVSIGAALAGQLSVETAFAAGAIAGGTLTGLRLRSAIEGFLGARRRLMRDVARVPVAEDPFVYANLLLSALARWTPLRTPSIIWFTPDGRSTILAVAGADLPPDLQQGRDLPESRNTVIRSLAHNGPWISGWTIRSDDGGYSSRIAALGVHAAAYVPLVFEGQVIGAVAAGLTDRGDDRSGMAEYVPTLVQFADAVAVALGPSLATKFQLSTARQLIDGILERAAFTPVFQPIRRLSGGRIVGYEALTRFASPVDTSEIFNKARVAGQLRDLEESTMAAAAFAAAKLPSGCWLSLNCSPDLLIDTDVLAKLLAPIRQPIVLELSEQDAIKDYEPIAAALGRIGSKVRLAVDDAGAGFASLRHILEVRPQFVKLDLGLVQGVATDLTRTALVAGFVRFAADAGFELIAEGIETNADRLALQRLGVELGQGYLLGRPGTAASVAEQVAHAHRGKVEKKRPRVTKHRPVHAHLHTGTIRHLPAP
jgi:EAL domain-containing protein (putative c-di-GMP-specific phosphodiesterase class I)